MQRSLVAFLGVPTLAMLALSTACSGPTRGRDPDIAVEPGTVVLFGRVVVGETARLPLRVRNVGAGPLVVSGATLGAGSPFSFDASTLAATPLQPGEARDVDVVYAPTVGAPTEDLLYIASNDPDEPSLALLVRASNAGPHLRVTPALVDFGLIEGRAGPVTARVTNDGTENVTLAMVTLVGGAEFQIVAAGPAAGTVLAPGDGFDLQVAWAEDPASPGSGRIDIRGEEAGTPDARLELRAPPLAVVGADIDGEPLVGVTLDGMDSRAPGNAVTGYRWTVVEAPIGSQTAADFTAGLPQIVRDEEKCAGGQDQIASPCFYPDVPGIYRFGLVVLDERPLCSLRSAGEACGGDAECCSFSCGATCQAAMAGAGVCASAPAQGCAIASENVAVQTLRAIPEQAVFVTLSWDGDGDLDLHMARDSGVVHTWTSIDDVFWSNPQPDWGVVDPTNGMTCTTSTDCTMMSFTTCRKPPGMPGSCYDTTDDPRLVIDDTNGFGPEAIEMRLPPSDTYHVGVHYFPDEHMAPRRATVRVFVLGVERFPPGFGPMSPLSVIMHRNEFWYVGRIVLPPVIDSVTIEDEPLSATNPRDNADPSNYPPIP